MQPSAMATNISESSTLLSAIAVRTSVQEVRLSRTTLALCCAQVTRLSSVVDLALFLSTSSTLMLLFPPLFKARLLLPLSHQTLASRHLVFPLPAFALPPMDRPLLTRTTLPTWSDARRTHRSAHMPAPRQSTLTLTAWLLVIMLLQLTALLSRMSEEPMVRDQELVTSRTARAHSALEHRTLFRASRARLVL